MTTTAAITNNWQIHLPLAARKIAGIDKPGVVTVTAKTGQLVISLKKSRILALGGSLNRIYIKKPTDIDKVRDQIDYSLS